MKVQKLIGIGGTNASGKDTIAHMLAKRYGWLFVSVSEILREESKIRGLPIERKNLRALSAEWRRESGLGVLIDKAIKQYDPKKYKGLVISSLRNFGEADRVHELGGKIVWTDADPKIRYMRIQSRKRSAEDNKTFEQFLTSERNELHHKDGDESSLNMSGVKERADIFIENHDNDIEAFKNQAEEALAEFL